MNASTWLLLLGSQWGTDNAGHHLLQHQAKWQSHSGINQWDVQLEWSDYGRDNSDNGIVEFSGAEPSGTTGFQRMFGPIWSRTEIGLQGEPSANSLVGKGVLAYVLQNGQTRWVPRIAVERAPLAQHALPLSLASFYTGVETGAEWSSPKSLGDISLAIRQWNTVSIDGRIANTAETSVEGPRQVLGSAYGLYNETWGWVVSGETNDRTTQIMTQATPDVRYQWLPAAAPRVSGAVAALLQHQILQGWHIKAVVPLVSGQIREWESTRVKDWGTASLELSTSAHIGWDPVGFTLQGGWRSTPWNHMDYLGPNAFTEFNAQILLETKL